MVMVKTRNTLFDLGQTGEMGTATEEEDPNSSGILLHVHDLPQLYTKPSASSLLETLALLTRRASSFSTPQQSAGYPSADPTQPSGLPVVVDSPGITRYLTTMIASPLAWIEDYDVREQIWTLASARISERSGRAAMPTMLRTFTVYEDIAITLREPSLTGDNLGLKTWTSSLLLAKRLGSLRRYIPSLHPSTDVSGCSSPLRILELGAGTGLVGITAACVFGAAVTLSDLPEIVPNLANNIEQNAALVATFPAGKACSLALDWGDAANNNLSSLTPYEQFPIILAADPLYSPEHPKLLVETVKRWLGRSSHARFIVELPLRGGYDRERAELQARLREAGLEIVAEGREMGYDDWEGNDGKPSEVRCWWAVWRFSESIWP